MSKPIYGDSTQTSAGGDCAKDATLIPGLMAQTSGLLSTLTGNNKSSVMSQLDNIRQQVMIIAGQGTLFTPFAAKTNRDIGTHVTRDESGKITLKGSVPQATPAPN